MSIRKGETINVPLRSKRVPLLVIVDGKLSEAQTPTEKLTLLRSAEARRPDAVIVAVWPGEWRSDTFTLDRAEALKILDG